MLSLKAKSLLALFAALQLLGWADCEAASAATQRMGTFSADSMEVSNRTGYALLVGDAVYKEPGIVVEADHIEVINGNDPLTRELKASGKVRFWQKDLQASETQLNAAQLHYQAKDAFIDASGRVVLTQHDAVNAIVNVFTAESLNAWAPNNELQRLIATGSPAHLRRRGDDIASVDVDAQRIDYQAKEQLLTLTGSVFFKQAGDEVRAAKLIYRGDQESYQVPAQPNQRVHLRRDLPAPPKPAGGDQSPASNDRSGESADKSNTKDEQRQPGDNLPPAVNSHPDESSPLISIPSDHPEQQP